MFSSGQHVEDAAYHFDASALNLVVAGESKEDQTVFCDVSGATATTDFHTVVTNFLFS